MLSTVYLDLLAETNAPHLDASTFEGTPAWCHDEAIILFRASPALPPFLGDEGGGVLV